MFSFTEKKDSKEVGRQV